MVFGIFIGFFALFLHSASPWLAPYRDAGEMAVLLKTLGVAHPPGYPLYTLLGKLFVHLPMGSAAYRANVFSALFAAGALVIFYVMLRKFCGRLPSFLAIAILGFSFPFWELGAVSEMYSLGAFWLSLILLTCLEKEYRIAFPLLYALGLGVRMDLLLILPVFVLWMAWDKPLPNIKLSAVFFSLGLSVFLYLPIRSLTNPLIDWGNPDTLSALFASMSRKSYSGTLDLLSLAYRKGENFGINMTLYAQHLWNSFKPWGIILAVIGAVSLFKTNKRVGLLAGVLFLVSGPVFLFLANMPPNPHSMAIVEASYLVPDILLVLFIGAGAEWAWRIRPAGPAVVWICAALLFFNATHGYARSSKRNNFAARDYTESTLRSIPHRSVAVFHDDVQLFSLWYAQLAENKRADVALISSGLSGSEWYWDMKKRWGTAVSPEISLKSSEGWSKMSSALGNRPFVVGLDVDIPPDGNINVSGHGMVMWVGSQPAQELRRGVDLLREFTIDRAAQHYGETTDFFSSDLIVDAARAHDRLGLSLLLAGEKENVEWLFRRAENLDATFPRASSDLAYFYFSQGNFPAARKSYEASLQKNRELLRQTVVYKSLPDVVQSVKTDYAATCVSLGGTLERMGDKKAAAQLYDESLSVAPSAQAHYNLAVLSWNQDWPRVVQHLEQALRLNPGMQEAQNYLLVARSKSQSSPRRTPGSSY